MTAWDLRFSLTTGPRRVEGRMTRPELGEASAFIVAPGPGRRRARLLQPADWAIDDEAMRRKCKERHEAFMEAVASNPELCPPEEATDGE